MKNKKTIIIISVLTILITLSASIVYANIGLINDNTEKNFYENREGAAKTKEFTMANSKVDLPDTTSEIKLAKNTSELKYKETINYNPNLVCDVYTDEKGNEYEYDSKGMLKGFRGSSEILDYEIATQTNKSISKDEAIALAKKYIDCVYGDLTKDYVLDSVNLLYTGEYSLDYSRKFGEGGFISGSLLSVKILPSGALSYCTIVNYDLYDDFDFSRLDGITYEIVDNYVKEQVNKDSDKELKYEYAGIFLSKDDGEFKIKAVVFIDSFLDDNTEITVEATYYYELS